MNDSVIERRHRRTANRTGCAVEATLSVIGGLWKPVVLFHLLGGKLRFNALCRIVPATPRMLTLQLRQLEADGVIRRIVYQEVPPKVEYELTDLGRSLEPVLLSMRNWGVRFKAVDAQAAGGAACAEDTPGCGPRTTSTSASTLPPVRP
jgi:DNA-binding HxlR family transcriptional regulator